MTNSEKHPDFAKPKTSYRKFRCYEKGVAIYDLTEAFVRKNLAVGDRTKDQMLQAARSGKSNFVEGRTDAAVSIQMEISLYGTAIGSLEELLNDYEDFMRTRQIPIWEKNHPRMLKLRETCSSHNDTKYYMSLSERLNLEEFCNMMLTLIHQNLVMLKKMQGYAKQDFLTQGGIKEQMYRARTAYRQSQGGYPPKDS